MRDYDPTTGRYIQADPLGLVDGPSVYGYALQNPGRYVDPKGLAIHPGGQPKPKYVPKYDGCEVAAKKECKPAKKLPGFGKVIYLVCEIMLGISGSGDEVSGKRKRAAKPPNEENYSSAPKDGPPKRKSPKDSDPGGDPSNFEFTPKDPWRLDF